MYMCVDEKDILLKEDIHLYEIERKEKENRFHLCLYLMMIHEDLVSFFE